MASAKLPTFSTYTEAASMLHDLNAKRYRNPARKGLIGNNTFLEQRTTNTIAVRYHDTDIITIDRDDLMTFDHGGWDTMTTLERMDQFARRHGLRVSRRNWQTRLTDMDLDPVATDGWDCFEVQRGTLVLVD